MTPLSSVPEDASDFSYVPPRRFRSARHQPSARSSVSTKLTLPVAINPLQSQKRALLCSKEEPYRFDFDTPNPFHSEFNAAPLFAAAPPSPNCFPVI
ncbi:hypothetical protein H4Q26_011248 [Puccinia striiformis f. sp. tritici PST-130]|nr:hypothetical protein H4Q26_011248 [Puccinia striiformis f. sp. tritici PST-130]